MGKITSKDMVDLLYYKKLPQVYRDKDSEIKYPLKRYLESLIYGGYYSSIDDIEGILSLTDPMTIPEEFFSYLCSSFGLSYFPDMDISYQRKFLANIGELSKRRGTFSSVQFLIRAITGLDCELSYENGNLNIVLLAKNLAQINDIDTSTSVIRNYISSQIPYYVNPVLSSKIVSQIIGSKSYSHSAVGYYKFYTLGVKPSMDKPDNSGNSNRPGSSDDMSINSVLGTGKLGNIVLGG